MRVKRWPCYVVVLLLLAACSNTGETPQSGLEETDEEGVEEEVREQDYEVLLGNALNDTLRGRAAFGLVVDSDTGEQIFVIELVSGYDFAGGFFIAHGGAGPPATGTHELVAFTDSLRSVPRGGYAVVYRQGMLRDLVSQRGTVTFSTVTDTLIAGTLDATLRGFVAIAQRRLPNAEVHARGRFRARPGSPGYIIGL